MVESGEFNDSFYFSCASVSERESVSSCMHIVNLHLRFGVNTRN